MATPDWGTSEFLVKNGYVKLDKESFLKPDFLVFPGGADVSPELYFEVKESRTHSDKFRDLEECNQLMAARLYGIPCIGICRGIQFLHAMSGGTLTQHIEGHAGPKHNVITKDNTKILVTSSHHQCVAKKDWAMYEEVYYAEDGTIEAIYSEVYNWAGVQWHPEYRDASVECQKFFIDMIEKLTNKVGF